MTSKSVLIGVVVLVILVAAPIAYLRLRRAAPTPTTSPPPQTEAPPTTVTIVDAAGRNVTIKLPVERIVVLNSDAAEAILILGSKDKIVGVSDTVHKHAYLGMGDKAVIGSWKAPDYEKIAELKPQIVISYAKWPGSELEENLAPFNITVVRLDFYKPETFDSDLQKLAKILGAEKKAEEFLAWRASITALLEERIRDLSPEEKVRVYVEFGRKPWKTFSRGSATHQAIVAVGAINIAEGFNVSYPVVSGEWVLEQNPDVMVIADYGRVTGYDVENDTAVKELREEFCTRPELKETSAVKNGRVYVINSKLLGGSRTYIGELYLAKWFYPDKFEDVDPETLLKEYFERWLGVTYKGIWVYP